MMSNKATLALLLAGISVIAVAQTLAEAVTPSPRTPVGYSWVTYAWVLGLSLWGGIVAHVRKYTGGTKPDNPLASLIVDVGSSGLIGILVFWACEYWKVEQLLSSVLIGVFGHMGARAFVVLEPLVLRRFQGLWGTTDSSKGEGK